jgi:D-alanine transaminase
MPADTIVYLNGRYLPRSEAHLDIEDRAALFADGVYEVVRYYAGRPCHMDAHLQRLATSCRAIDLPFAEGAATLDRVSDELVQRNGWPDATVYWQVSRGVAPRRHAYDANMTPTVLAIPAPAATVNAHTPIRTVGVITTPDTRWTQCWIKSLMLLPNVLAKSAAVRAGCDEALFVRDGVLTEGTSTSAIVVRDGELWSHPLDGRVLPSVTLAHVKELARAAGLTLHDRAYPAADLPSAQELMICGTTTMVAAVITVDGQVVGDGAPGAITRRLHRLMLDEITA